MADAAATAAPTVEKVTADPATTESGSGAVPAPTSAPAQAPPAATSVDEKGTEKKDESKVEKAKTDDKGPEKRGEEEANGTAAPASAQEPKPDSIPATETKPAATAQTEEKATVTADVGAARPNGEAKDVEIKDAVNAEAEATPETGDKRKAYQQSGANGANGAGPESAGDNKEAKSPKVEAQAPVGKRQKMNGTNEAAPARKASRGKKEKKQLPPVGRTERRTRSQGLA